MVSFQSERYIEGCERRFRNFYETPKTTTKAIPRVTLVRMSTKDDIVEKRTVENEEIFEGGGKNQGVK